MNRKERQLKNRRLKKHKRKLKKSLREGKVNKEESPKELKRLTQSHATCDPAPLKVRTKKHAVPFAMSCLMTLVLSGYAVTSVTFGTIWNAPMCLRIASQTLSTVIGANYKLRSPGLML